jgi:hypothetical protein
MALFGLAAASNLADVTDRERAWDNIGANFTANLTSDPDSVAYVTAVEAADGQSLEPAVRLAIGEFILGCKQDGIWDAIKASCILGGARTLAGALVPLVGTAPTNFNFVSGDYDRKTGLVGNGSTKYLNTNRNNNADLQDNRHVCVAANLPDNGNKVLIGVRAVGTNSGGFEIRHQGTSYYVPISNTSVTVDLPSTGSLNFLGYSRSSIAEYISRRNQTNTTVAQLGGSAIAIDVTVFTRTDLAIKSNSRIAFYSIGESLDLALLDARVTALISAFAAAIP